jgi:hypothetical protein
LVSEIRDPEKTYSGYRIPDPGVKKAPDPGSRIRIRNTGKRIIFIIIFIVADTSWKWREARRSRARAASGALTLPARLSWLSRWVNLTLWTSSSLNELHPHFINFIVDKM